MSPLAPFPVPASPLPAFRLSGFLLRASVANILIVPYQREAVKYNNVE